ncbi:uncharacterized protein, partial [Paramisgurnus dabryanus]|uniref:uncharacterized protein n=1 Tax=Paramisgurnus dabryanus TaxID=90735 RepID=UPI003CCF39BB
YVPEIQNAGSGGRPITNPSTSLFTTHIPITHPLKALLDASLDSILQAVSPRTINSYLTAWRCFKTFHLSFNLQFPDFSLLTITSFISYLNSVKNLQVGSIKGYLSGIQFFHKLIYGFPSPEINNSQTSLLIKGIQRSRPSKIDSRQPITLDILTKCIQILRTGYHSSHTAHTLDAMFLLSFFGFLRCSEIAINSKFNPKIHPTISDLSILDSESIAYFIKQSKTDQEKKGHYIYIFNLPSPIQPYQALLSYLKLRNAQSKSAMDPLFVDDSNHPVTRFWFQKHLKQIIALSGLPVEHFSSHSFRIGAATTAAQKGLSQNQIQALGRWSSDAFKSYIRYNHLHIKEAHAAMIASDRAPLLVQQTHGSLRSQGEPPVCRLSYAMFCDGWGSPCPVQQSRWLPSGAAGALRPTRQPRLITCLVSIRQGSPPGAADPRLPSVAGRTPRLLPELYHVLRWMGIPLPGAAEPLAPFGRSRSPPSDASTPL